SESRSTARRMPRSTRRAARRRKASRTCCGHSPPRPEGRPGSAPDAAWQNIACTEYNMHYSAIKRGSMTPMISFETHPERYRHWKLSVEGRIAILAMDVAEDGGLK